MFRADAEEAASMVDEVLAYLLAFGPVRGRQGADMRTAIGKARANARRALQTDTFGPSLIECFEAAQRAGVTREEFGQVRKVAAAITPVSTAAIAVKNSIIQLCLAVEADILRVTAFHSRVEAEATRDELNEAFAEAQEEAADAMDSATFRALVELQAAVSFYLVENARPLPRLLRYQFANIQPTLVMAQKLYADAGRANELRVENKIIHPAFAPRQGRAMSS